MIDIVFGDSAAGSLKMAQNYGKGPFRSPAMSVIVRHSDGREASASEIEAARRQAGEQERLAWENAVPMGGNPTDIYSLGLAHSIGDIAGDGIGKNRLSVLNRLFSVYPDEAAQAAREICDRAADSLETVRRRLCDGENARLWYSSQPDEMCGLYWFMSQLEQWPGVRGEIYAVRLPDWESDGRTVTVHTGWGEIAAGEWHRYEKLQTEIPPVFVSAAASRWSELQRENAALRAVINGRLYSVPEDFYDHFITRELAAQGGEFHEAQLIGRVLGNCQLGISDGWIALRIEEMIERGELAAVTAAPAGGPNYRRLLRKVGG